MPAFLLTNINKVERRPVTEMRGIDDCQHDGYNRFPVYAFFRFCIIHKFIRFDLKLQNYNHEGMKVGCSEAFLLQR